MSTMKRSIFTLALATSITTLSFAQDSLTAPEVQLDVSVASPVMPADKKQTTFVKVGLTGFALPSAEDRPPVNVALVIDKSGSMQGDKIAKAKQAAVAAIDRLRADDIVSIVVYHDGVQVVLPATKLTDKESVRAAIRSIQVGGSTALFAGVSKGAAEVRKFLDDGRVSRVILLSDGRANVGPNSAIDLGELGASLLKENIAVTTLGLGLDYNEDLMTKLAVRSNGNYLFVENADDLIATFNHEFNDVLSVVAQEITIDVNVREGIRPVRVLGHEAHIHGQSISIQLNQLYANQERFILIEVEVPPTRSGAKRNVADVDVRYANMLTKSTDTLFASSTISFSTDAAELTSGQNRDVAEKAALLVANERNRRATLLRDQGKVAEARKLLIANYVFLGKKANSLDSLLLQQQRQLNQIQASNLDSLNWKKTRKLMMRDNAAVEQQSSGYGGYGGDGGSGAYGGGGYQGYGGGYGGNSEADSRIITTPNQPKKQQSK